MATSGRPRNEIEMEHGLAVQFKEGDSRPSYMSPQPELTGRRRSASAPLDESEPRPCPETADNHYDDVAPKTSGHDQRKWSGDSRDDLCWPRRQHERNQSSGRISLSDVIAMVKPFTGTNKQNALKWFHSFLAYANFKQIFGHARLDLFKMLMVDNAADWILTLSPSIGFSEQTLFDAFKNRFGYTEAQKVKAESQLWHRTQGENETVDDYVTAMRLEAYQLQMPEKQLFKIISHGFKEPIKLFVMNSSCQSIDEILSIARTCEAANGTDKPNKQQLVIEELTDIVKQLRVDIAKAATSDVNRITSITPSYEHHEDEFYTHAVVNQPYEHNHSQQQAPRQPVNRSHNYQNYQAKYTPPQHQNFRSSRPQFPQQQFYPRQQQDVAWRPDISRYQQQQPTHTQRTPNSQSGRIGRCTRFCGRMHVLGREHCMASNMVCYSCGQVGHLRAVCGSQTMGQQSLNRA